MMIENGRVVAVEKDSVWVETIRRSTCGSCAAQKGCGHGLLNRISDGQRGYVRVLSGEVESRDCSVDDEVSFSLPEEVILRGSLIVYMLPLLTMLAGAGGVSWGLPQAGDLAALLGALSGFAIGLALVRAHASRHRSDPALQPILVDIIEHRAGTQPVQVN